MFGMVASSSEMQRLNEYVAHRARIRTVKSWDEEWGKLKTEGNIWWLGSPRKNWEQTMGKNPWGWIREWSRD